MKKIWIPVLTLSLIVGGLYAGSRILAVGFGNQRMADSLAEKLGKSTDEVETAFNAVREEHQATRQAEYEERLSQAVENGELTEAQKQLILDKHTELQAKRQAEWEARQQEREALEAWAQENRIDNQYLFGFGPRGGGMGRGGMGGRGMHGDL